VNEKTNVQRRTFNIQRRMGGTAEGLAGAGLAVVRMMNEKTNVQRRTSNIQRRMGGAAAGMGGHV